MTIYQTDDMEKITDNKYEEKSLGVYQDDEFPGNMQDDYLREYFSRVQDQPLSKACRDRIMSGIKVRQQDKYSFKGERLEIIFASIFSLLLIAAFVWAIIHYKLFPEEIGLKFEFHYSFPKINFEGMEIWLIVGGVFLTLMISEIFISKWLHNKSQKDV